MQIYPYINQMIEELHIAPNKASIGYASGVILSSISIAQIFTNLFWGRVSDRIGRKPALLCGLFGYAISALLFGTSKSFHQMFLARLSMGVLSGNVPIIYSVLSDISDDTNRARVIPLNEVTWQIGAFVGSFVGGMLPHPVERYPNLFGNLSIFKDWPFLLPCLASFTLSTVAFLCTLFFFEETLPRIVAQRKAMSLGESDNSLAGSVIPREGSSTVPLPTTVELLSDPLRRRIIAAGFCLAFFAIGFDPLFSLWNYTPIPLGGLGRETREIGLLLSTAALVGMFLNAFVFHRLERRFGSLTLFITGMSLWSINFIAMPIISAVLRTFGMSVESSESPQIAGLWFATLSVLIVEKMASLAYPAYLLVVRAAVPDSGSVGAVFGLAQTAGSIGKCLGPAFMSSLFAFSIESQILEGQLVWVVLLGITFLARQFASTIRRLHDGGIDG
ncbi:hypothetical protein FRB90_008257 [Tulasnella sp. 427]|nr:hypothetical protein FRB90_008257 [Tulasnella sp. 427]